MLSFIGLFFWCFPALFLLNKRRGYRVSIGNCTGVDNNGECKRLTHFDPFPWSTLFKNLKKNCFHPRRKSKDLLPSEDDLSPVRREKAQSFSVSRHRTKSRSPSPAPEKKEKPRAPRAISESKRSFQYKRPLLLGKYIKIHF